MFAFKSSNLVAVSPCRSGVSAAVADSGSVGRRIEAGNVCAKRTFSDLGRSSGDRSGSGGQLVASQRVPALGASLFSLTLYSGLVLFSALVLLDTQRVIQYGEAVEQDKAIFAYSMDDFARRCDTFDPINAQIGFYAGILNIFVRIAAILGHVSHRRRR